MRAVSHEAVVEIEGDQLRISSNPQFQAGPGETRTISLAALSGIRFKDAGWFRTGHIQFVHAGNRPPPGTIAWLLGRGDPDTVSFHRPDQKGFEELRDALEARISSPS